MAFPPPPSLLAKKKLYDQQCYCYFRATICQSSYWKKQKLTFQFKLNFLSFFSITHLAYLYPFFNHTILKNTTQISKNISFHESLLCTDTRFSKENAMSLNIFCFIQAWLINLCPSGILSPHREEEQSLDQFPAQTQSSCLQIQVRA